MSWQVQEAKLGGTICVGGWVGAVASHDQPEP
jgi:hypothetical protein